MPTVEQLEAFLRNVDRDFPVPLSQKQDLGAYARKLHEKATLCAAYDGEEICALVAGYTNDLANGTAYIAVVATLSRARGRGLASSLVKEFIRICKQKGIGSVHLYARHSNIPAMSMYYGLGFRDLRLPDEPRPEDAHLIYELEA